jgi:peptide/nickel transport system permease protein
MPARVARRLLIAIPVLWGVLTLTFIGFHLVPGGPAQAILSQNVVNGTGRAPTSADIRLLEHQLGLDRPLYIQYLDFLAHAARGDFGRSYASHRSVWSLIEERLPYTAALAIAAWLLSTVFGVATGILAALWNRRALGIGISALMVLIMSLPNFWVGAILALVFGVELRWLPVEGTGDLRHLILPAVTVAAILTARVTRQTRVAMVEALRQDHIRTARGKGIRRARIVLRHALPNAFIPLITILGLEIAGLLGGVVIVENVFSWPGLGVLSLNAVDGRDFPVIEGTTFVFAVILVATNLLVDVSYEFVDPRVRSS